MSQVAISAHFVNGLLWKMGHFGEWSQRHWSLRKLKWSISKCLICRNDYFFEVIHFSKCLLFKVTNFLNWPIFSKCAIFRNLHLSETTHFSKRQILRSGSESGSFSKTIWQARNSFFTVIKVFLPETALPASLNDTIVIFLFESWYRRAEFYIQSKFVKVWISKLVSFFN